MRDLKTTIKRPVGKQGEKKSGSFTKKQKVNWTKLLQYKHKERNDRHLVSFSEYKEEKRTI